MGTGFVVLVLAVLLGVSVRQGRWTKNLHWLHWFTLRRTCPWCGGTKRARRKIYVDMNSLPYNGRCYCDWHDE